MLKEELIAKSPVRLLEKSIEGGLKAGGQHAARGSERAPARTLVRKQANLRATPAQRFGAGQARCAPARNRDTKRARMRYGIIRHRVRSKPRSFCGQDPK